MYDKVGGAGVCALYRVVLMAEKWLEERRLRERAAALDKQVCVPLCVAGSTQCTTAWG